MAIYSRSPLFQILSLALFAVLTVPGRDFAQTPSPSRQAPSTDLTTMSIEDLMNVEVTSAAKREQKISQVAAAVFVITHEDIQRSGARNIPDLLRMVPGVQVAQINANCWAISVRGFNRRFSSELLVMVDGRTVYTPLFAGVFWDTLDVPLNDIERIEVIRGPGGSVWGANAVNGIINIITKKAASTKGTYLAVTGGTSDAESADVQYGGEARHLGDYRVFTSYATQGSLRDPAGTLSGDGWHRLHGGFRSDSQLTSDDSLSVQGEMYSMREGVQSVYLASLFPPAPFLPHSEVDLGGASLEGNWNHRFSSHSDTTLILSYQGYDRTAITREDRRTFDIDFQHNLTLGERQQFTWGLNYRRSTYQTEAEPSLSFVPPDRDTDLYGGFLQDQFTLVADRLDLIVGSKLEHNAYTGFGFMPTGRLAWTPGADTILWAAVSRALRTPADSETGLRLDLGVFSAPDGTPVLERDYGNPHQQDVTLLSYETGFRTILTSQVSLDLAGYYNSYHHLPTLEPGATFVELDPLPAHLVLPLIVGNLMYGESHGLEAFANWKLTSRWTLSPGYAFEGIHLHLDPQSHDTLSVGYYAKATPVHSAQLRSHLELTSQLKWDLSAYFVDRITYPAVPSYTRLDTGLAWQLKNQLTFGVYGENLLRDRHLEFEDVSNTAGTSLMKRAVVAKLQWSF